MSKLLYALIFSIVSFAFAQSNAAASAPLVSISSVYTTPAGHHVIMHGTGIYLATAQWHGNVPTLNRFFVLSVGHVTGGDHVKIEINGAPVSEIGRASLSRKDISLFEIARPSSGMPLAVWNPHYHAFINAFAVTETMTRNATNYILQSFFGDERVRPFFRGNDVADSEGPGLERSMAAFIAIPMGAELPSRAREFDFLREGGSTRTVINSLSGEIVFKANIAPGMSGSPVFVPSTDRINSKEVSVLVGLASQYSRRFDYSFASDPDSINTLVTRYLRGDRGELIETLSGHRYQSRWRFNAQCTTLREVVEVETGTVIARETPLTAVGGNGTNGDGGNGTNGDGGNGTNGDGGNGTNGDGGNGTNGDGGNGTNGDGGRGSCATGAPSATAPFYFRGSNARLFQLTDRTSHQSAVVQADMFALDFILANERNLLVRPISDRSQFFSLFRNRMDHLSSSSARYIYKEVSLTQANGGYQLALAHFTWGNFRDGFDRATVQINSLTLTYGRETARWGDKFLAVNVPGTGRRYLVDLDDLYAINLSQLNTPLGSSYEQKWRIISEHFELPFVFLNATN